MNRIIKVGQGEYIGNDNGVLQRAVDDAARVGGVVHISAGIFEMHNALHLRDNVRVIGEPGTILQKAPSVQSTLNQVAGYGHFEFSVSESELFEIGMGVLLSDDNAYGFYTTVGTIIDRVGDYFYLDRPFAHDYRPQANAVVTSVFSLIEAFGVRECSVQNITLDGNYPTETREMNGCRGAGVFLLQSHGAWLDNIQVQNFHGDAISFQQCTDIEVTNCNLHHNTGGGIHPGSGSVRYWIQKNRISENGVCGIYYCLRTTHSLCEGNVITGNKAQGISIGERDTDHIIRGNVIENNGGAGIELRDTTEQSADRCWIEGNDLKANNQAGKSAEMCIAHDLRDIGVIGNRIETDGKAFVVGASNSNLSIAENWVNDRAQNAEDFSDEIENVSFAKPEYFPLVGPEATNENSARHLDKGLGVTFVITNIPTKIPPTKFSQEVSVAFSDLLTVGNFKISHASLCQPPN